MAKENTPRVVDSLEGIITDDMDLASAQEVETATRKNTTARAILTVLLILLLIAIFAACAALFGYLGFGAGGSGANDTGGIMWIRSIYGFGTGIDQRHNPQSVSIAPDGASLWVVDTSRRRVIEYDMNGALKQVRYTYKGQAFEPAPLAENGESMFLSPSQIAVAPNGTIFVAEQSYHRVLILDPNFVLKGEILVEWPHSLAVNSQMLLVGGQGGFAAYRLDGTLIGSIGTVGTEPDQFDRILGMALDGQNNAYIMDSYNNRLNKFDEAGDLVWQVTLGPAGNEGINAMQQLSSEAALEKWPAMMQIPQGVTIDGAGRVVVIDFFDFTVAAFSPEDGSFIGKWGVYGLQDGQFSYPNGIAYNRQQDVFASTEATLGRVQIFRIPDSGGGVGTTLQRNLGNLARACCWPLLILLLLVALYYLYQYLTKKRRKTSELVEADDADTREANLEDTKVIDVE